MAVVIGEIVSNFTANIDGMLKGIDVVTSRLDKLAAKPTTIQLNVKGDFGKTITNIDKNLGKLTRTIVNTERLIISSADIASNKLNSLIGGRDAQIRKSAKSVRQEVGVEATTLFDRIRVAVADSVKGLVRAILFVASAIVTIGNTVVPGFAAAFVKTAATSKAALAGLSGYVASQSVLTTSIVSKSVMVVLAATLKAMGLVSTVFSGLMVAILGGLTAFQLAGALVSGVLTSISDAFTYLKDLIKPLFSTLLNNLATSLEIAIGLNDQAFIGLSTMEALQVRLAAFTSFGLTLFGIGTVFSLAIRIWYKWISSRPTSVLGRLAEVTNTLFLGIFNIIPPMTLVLNKTAAFISLGAAATTILVGATTGVFTGVAALATLGSAIAGAIPLMRNVFAIGQIGMLKLKAVFGSGKAQFILFVKAVRESYSAIQRVTDSIKSLPRGFNIVRSARVLGRIIAGIHDTLREMVDVMYGGLTGVSTLNSELYKTEGTTKRIKENVGGTLSATDYLASAFNEVDSRVQRHILGLSLVIRRVWQQIIPSIANVISTPLLLIKSAFGGLFRAMGRQMQSALMLPLKDIKKGIVEFWKNTLPKPVKTALGFIGKSFKTVFSMFTKKSKDFGEAYNKIWKPGQVKRQTAAAEKLVTKYESLTAASKKVADAQGQVNKLIDVEIDKIEGPLLRAKARVQEHEKKLQELIGNKLLSEKRFVENKDIQIRRQETALKNQDLSIKKEQDLANKAVEEAQRLQGMGSTIKAVRGDLDRMWDMFLKDQERATIRATQLQADLANNKGVIAAGYAELDVLNKQNDAINVRFKTNGEVYRRDQEKATAKAAILVRQSDLIDKIDAAEKKVVKTEGQLAEEKKNINDKDRNAVTEKKVKLDELYKGQLKLLSQIAKAEAIASPVERQQKVSQLQTAYTAEATKIHRLMGAINKVMSKRGDYLSDEQKLLVISHKELSKQIPKQKALLDTEAKKIQSAVDVIDLGRAQTRDIQDRLKVLNAERGQKQAILDQHVEEVKATRSALNSAQRAQIVEEQRASLSKVSDRERRERLMDLRKATDAAASTEQAKIREQRVWIERRASVEARSLAKTQKAEGIRIETTNEGLRKLIQTVGVAGPAEVEKAARVMSNVALTSATTVTKTVEDEITAVGTKAIETSGKVSKKMKGDVAVSAQDAAATITRWLSQDRIQNALGSKGGPRTSLLAGIIGSGDFENFVRNIAKQHGTIKDRFVSPTIASLNSVGAQFRKLSRMVGSEGPAEIGKNYVAYAELLRTKSQEVNKYLNEMAGMNDARFGKALNMWGKHSQDMTAVIGQAFQARLEGTLSPKKVATWISNAMGNFGKTLGTEGVTKLAQRVSELVDTAFVPYFRTASDAPGAVDGRHGLAPTTWGTRFINNMADTLTKNQDTVAKASMGVGTVAGDALLKSSIEVEEKRHKEMTTRIPENMKAEWKVAIDQMAKAGYQIGKKSAPLQRMGKTLFDNMLPDHTQLARMIAQITDPGRQKAFIDALLPVNMVPPRVLELMTAIGGDVAKQLPQAMRPTERSLLNMGKGADTFAKKALRAFNDPGDAVKAFEKRLDRISDWFKGRGNGALTKWFNNLWSKMTETSRLGMAIDAQLRKTFGHLTDVAGRFTLVTKDLKGGFVGVWHILVGVTKTLPLVAIGLGALVPGLTIFVGSLVAIIFASRDIMKIFVGIFTLNWGKIIDGVRGLAKNFVGLYQIVLGLAKVLKSVFSGLWTAGVAVFKMFTSPIKTIRNLFKKDPTREMSQNLRKQTQASLTDSEAAKAKERLALTTDAYRGSLERLTKTIQFQAAAEARLKALYEGNGVSEDGLRKKLEQRRIIEERMSKISPLSREYVQKAEEVKKINNDIAYSHKEVAKELVKRGKAMDARGKESKYLHESVVGYRKLSIDVKKFNNLSQEESALLDRQSKQLAEVTDGLRHQSKSTADMTQTLIKAHAEVDQFNNVLKVAAEPKFSDQDRKAVDAFSSAFLNVRKETNLTENELVQLHSALTGITPVYTKFDADTRKMLDQMMSESATRIQKDATRFRSAASALPQAAADGFIEGAPAMTNAAHNALAAFGDNAETMFRGEITDMTKPIQEEVTLMTKTSVEGGMEKARPAVSRAGATVGKAAVTGIADAVKTTADASLDVAGFLKRTLLKAGQDVGTEATSLAKNAVTNPLSQGIKDGEGLVRFALKGVLEKANAATRSTIELHMRTSGKTAIDLLTEGIKDGAPDLNKQLEVVLQSLLDYVPQSPPKKGPLAGTKLTKAGSKMVGMLSTGIAGGKKAITGVFGKVMQIIADFLPQSPPKIGPLAGNFLGQAGGRIIKYLSLGILSEKSTLNKALRVVFTGVFFPVFGPSGILIGLVTSAFKTISKIWSTLVNNSVRTVMQEVTGQVLEVGFAASRLGIDDVRQFDLFRKAARNVRIEGTQLVTIFNTLQRTVADAVSNPLSDASAKLERFGVDLDAVRRGEQSLVDVYLTLSDAAVQYANTYGRSSEQVKAILEATGSTFGQLQDLGLAGGEQIREWMREMGEMGNTIDNEAVAKARRFHEETVKLKTAWEGVRQEIVEMLLPRAIAFMERASKWWADYKDIVMGGIRTIWNILQLVFNFVARRFAEWMTVPGRFSSDMAASFDFLMKTIGTIAETFWSNLYPFASAFFEWLWVQVEPTFSRVFNQFTTELLPKVMEAVKGALTELGEWISSKGGFLGHILSVLSFVDRLADGIASLISGEDVQTTRLRSSLRSDVEDTFRWVTNARTNAETQMAALDAYYAKIIEQRDTLQSELDSSALSDLFDPESAAHIAEAREELARLNNEITSVEGSQVAYASTLQGIIEESTRLMVSRQADMLRVNAEAANEGAVRDARNAFGRETAELSRRIGSLDDIEIPVRLRPMTPEELQAQTAHIADVVAAQEAAQAANRQSERERVMADSAARMRATMQEAMRELQEGLTTNAREFADETGSGGLFANIVDEVNKLIAAIEEASSGLDGIVDSADGITPALQDGTDAANTQARAITSWMFALGGQAQEVRENIQGMAQGDLVNVLSNATALMRQQAEMSLKIDKMEQSASELRLRGYEDQADRVTNMVAQMRDLMTRTQSYARELNRLDIGASIAKGLSGEMNPIMSMTDEWSRNLLRVRENVSRVSDALREERAAGESYITGTLQDMLGTTSEDVDELVGRYRLKLEEQARVIRDQQMNDIREQFHSARRAVLDFNVEMAESFQSEGIGGAITNTLLGRPSVVEAQLAQVEDQYREKTASVRSMFRDLRSSVQNDLDATWRSLEDATDPDAIAEGEAHIAELEAQWASLTEQEREALSLSRQYFDDLAQQKREAPFKGMSDAIASDVADGFKDGMKEALKRENIGEGISKMSRAFIGTIFDAIADSMIDDLVSKLTKDLSASLTTMFEKVFSFAGDLAGTLASSVILIISLLLRKTDEEIASTQEQIDNAVEQTEQLRGIVSGETTVALKEVQDNLRDALVPTNNILVDIRDILRGGAGVTAGPSSSAFQSNAAGVSPI